MTISDAPSCRATYDQHSDYSRGVNYDGINFILLATAFFVLNVIWQNTQGSLARDILHNCNTYS